MFKINFKNRKRKKKLFFKIKIQSVLSSFTLKLNRNQWYILIPPILIIFLPTYLSFPFFLHTLTISHEFGKKKLEKVQFIYLFLSWIKVYKNYQKF